MKNTIDFSTALAFYPTYTDTGLLTCVVYPNETLYIDLSLDTVIKHACKDYALDRKALANAARFVSGKPHLVPLPLCVDKTFGPLKVHTPKFTGDAAYGYFLVQGIVRIELDTPGSNVHMRNGTVVHITQARNIALAHLARAILFERAFWSKRLGLSYYVDRQESR